MAKQKTRNDFENLILSKHINFVSHYKNKLTLIALSVFDWEIDDKVYLPKDVLEKNIMLEGRICAVPHKDYGYIFGKYNQVMGVDLYNKPKTVNISLSDNVKSKNFNLDSEDVCYCANNLLSLGCHESIELYSYMLARIELVRLMNLELSKGIVSGTIQNSNERTSMEIKLQSLYGIEPILTQNVSLQNSMDVLDVSFKGNEYNQYRKAIIGDFLEDIGVKAIDIEKGSHVLEEEVNRSEVSSNSLKSMLKNREDFCKELKEKFNLNFKVWCNADLKEVVEDVVNESEEIMNG